MVLLPHHVTRRDLVRVEGVGKRNVAENPRHHDRKVDDVGHRSQLRRWLQPGDLAGEADHVRPGHDRLAHRRRRRPRHAVCGNADGVAQDGAKQPRQTLGQSRQLAGTGVQPSGRGCRVRLVVGGEHGRAQRVRRGRHPLVVPVLEATRR